MSCNDFIYPIEPAAIVSIRDELRKNPKAMIDLMVAPSAIASPMGTEEYVRRLIRAFYSDRDLLLTRIHETESAPANVPRFPGVPMTVVSTRTYASKHELWAAKHFARQARQIEAAQTGSPKFNIQHRAFVTSAVRSAVGFLEAAINEVFTDVADGHDSYVAPLSDQCRQSMGSRWNRKTQRLKGRRDNKRPEILEKYQIALACSGNPVFEEDTQPYVDAELLISLRNRLTHARPETRAPSDEDEFADKLKGKFKLNPLTTNAYFPDSYLSAGCACWAFKTARALADEVFSRMKLTPNYQRPDSFPAP